MHNAEKIEAVWKSENKSLASKLEFHIKRLKKAEKEDIIITKDLSKYLKDKIEIDKYKFIGNTIK